MVHIFWAYMLIINMSYVILPNHRCLLFFSTPRKSTHKNVYTHTPSPSIDRVNSVTKWEDEHEDWLIDILREFLEEGVQPPYGQKLIHRITQRLNNQLDDGT